jgi:hypothetical protein
MARIIIHIPRKMKHLKSFAKEFLSIQDKKFLLIVEVYGTDFNINSKVETAESLISLFSKPRECLLSIKFTDLSIQVEVKDTKKFLSPVSIKFIEYPYDDNSNNDSIFENEEMRLNPEDFKDKLIESFKTRCPNKILNSFKSDEDIWNYILQKGEWSIKKGGV